MSEIGIQMTKETNSETRSDTEQNTKPEEAPRYGKYYILVPLVLLMIIGTQWSLLKDMAVFRTPLGGLLLGYHLLVNGVLAFLVTFVALVIYISLKRAIKTGEMELGAWWLGARLLIFVVALLILVFGILMPGIDFGLRNDVPYTWIKNKADLDMLKLWFIDGWTIWFTVIVAILFLLSDPRIRAHKGKDNRWHLYIHSKLVSLIRLLILSAADEETTGDNPDYPAMGRAKTVTRKRRRWQDEGTETETETVHSAVRFNDKIRLWPLGAIWLGIKFVIGLVIGSFIAHEIALKYVVVQNWAATTGTNISAVLGDYIGIVFWRLGFNIDIPVTWAIDKTFTFEVYQFFAPFIIWFAAIWAVRLILATIGEMFAGLDSFDEDAIPPAARIFSNIFGIVALAVLPALAGIGTWAYDKATPYDAFSLMAMFAVFAVLAVWLRAAAKSEAARAPFEWLLGLFVKEGVAPKVFACLLIFCLAILPMLAPQLVSSLVVEPYMQGKRQEYSWNPAYLPSIEFTNWAYETDTVEKSNVSILTTNSTDVLEHVRIFTDSAAKLNMKPHVGPNNWMSIDSATPDIIYNNETGREYWVSPLTLVLPPYGGDVDVWRATHMLLTHSEKILAVDALSTEITDFQTLCGLNQTPQVYYDEGGLWKSTDEVYINITGFPETHITDYNGPTSYDGAADYIFSGFWRMWKFYGMWRWDFASGDYGDIKTLVDRDIHARVNNILLPRMTLAPDPYPVCDGKGNIYELFWVWIDWKPSHGYADYAQDKGYDQILRKFAVVLVNLKDGKIDGYLMNKQRSDYILGFYRNWYSNWNKTIPSWLQEQLRYPEDLLERQIDVYNYYFQKDFQQFQRNKFYELTTDSAGNVIEDVRFIIVPINGVMKWSAVRLVEWYKLGSRNLVGAYIAPGGADTGKIYLVDLENVKQLAPEETSPAIIGPSIAISAINSNPEIKTQLELHKNWEPGNILWYSTAGRFYYIVPYYAQQADLVLPAMTTVVDALSSQAGYHVIANPKNANEVKASATYAFQKLKSGAVGGAAGTVNATAVTAAAVSMNVTATVTTTGNATTIVIYKDGAEKQRITIGEGERIVIIPPGAGG